MKIIDGNKKLTIVLQEGDKIEVETLFNNNIVLIIRCVDGVLVIEEKKKNM